LPTLKEATDEELIHELTHRLAVAKMAIATLNETLAQADKGA
jgi:uncharacterized coiled-coil protein SlyX